MSEIPDARAVLALLANQDTRTALSEISLGLVRLEPTKRYSRAVHRLRQAHVVVETEGELLINEPGLRTAVEAYSPQRPTGIARFVAGGRIVTYPSAHSDRLEVLRWVARQVLTPNERVSEAEFNERLKPFMNEHVLLRRYLVDYALVQRASDGSWYALPPLPPDNNPASA